MLLVLPTSGHLYLRGNNPRLTRTYCANKPQTYVLSYTLVGNWSILPLLTSRITEHLPDSPNAQCEDCVSRRSSADVLTSAMECIEDKKDIGLDLRWCTEFQWATRPSWQIEMFRVTIVLSLLPLLLALVTCFSSASLIVVNIFFYKFFFLCVKFPYISPLIEFFCEHFLFLPEVRNKSQKPLWYLLIFSRNW